MVRLRDSWPFSLSSAPTVGNPCRPLQSESVSRYNTLKCYLRRYLGVWSRDEVVRIDLEGRWVLCPGLADGLEGGSPLQPLQVLGEVVGRDKGQDVGLQALQVGVVEHLDGGI